MKKALITGATAGIGFHVAQELAIIGAQVIITGRNRERAKQAVDTLRHLSGNQRIEFLPADASSISSTLQLARQVSAEHEHLDVLINNVGGLFVDRQVTTEGFEATLVPNFLSPFALTSELLPLLKKSEQGRIVNVVSSAFGMWHDDPLVALDFEEDYQGLQAYARAKLLNLLWTLTLSRRLQDSSVTVNATNPGMAWTPGTQALTPQAVPAWRFIWPLVRLMQKRASPAKAARSSVFLASAEAVRGISGAYFDEMKQNDLPAHLLDPELQKRVWDLGMRVLNQQRALTEC
ncbi:MAG: SDR family NAD(P)-dependent oxidoreductase [Chloroflexi bacterium]|nr:SDR family NAD(P)-dependent oxidoreductase [Chloroflexota bacterium]